MRKLGVDGCSRVADYAHKGGMFEDVRCGGQEPSGRLEAQVGGSWLIVAQDHYATVKGGRHARWKGA